MRITERDVSLDFEVNSTQPNFTAKRDLLSVYNSEAILFNENEWNGEERISTNESKTCVPNEFDI